MASSLHVRYCGEPALLRHGRPLPLPASRKTRALLFLLLRSGREWHRTQLIDLFWQVPDDPRAALRWSLSKLRQALGENAWRIATRGDAVACDGSEIGSDLDEMQAALDPATPPSRLLALAEDAMATPLLGLDLPRSPGFDAWLAGERVAADAIRARLLLRAAEVADRAAAPRYRQAAEDADPSVSAVSDGADFPVPGPAQRAGRSRRPRADGALASAAHPSISATPALAVPQDAAAEETTSPPGETPWPQHVRYLTGSDGARLAYACTGDGPPLVKTANWLNHLELDWHSPLWGGLVRELCERHTLVRYDERGNGLSQWDVADIGFDAFVRDLEEVVDHLGLERFPLLGVSQGCAVSVEYAARHPERVSALVLIGGYATGWRVTGDAATRAEREATITLVRHGWGQDNPAYRQIFSHSFFPSGTAEELDWFNEFQRRTASAENAVRFLEAFSTIDVRARLADVRAPTRVVHARRDHRVPVEQATALAAGIPGAMLVTLDSDSHLPLDREPAHAAMLDAITGFLTTVASPEPQAA